ncbi:hypothetical protein PPYR_11603 [Photinus pyralis]|uniref:Uncharacterized protein n=1 Tax=Photinus pyralis TaxID=7054 RepID=A0A1Y1NFW5_PHOPY|nr:WD repeat-containing protein 38-like [Photinus pyralis]KAB0794764.1 hypothetical protein PPYR_11603 [Photinus pyralis]
METVKHRGPKRKSIAGPLMLPLPLEAANIFKVTSSFVRDQTGNTLKSAMGAMAAMENLLIEGGISIASSIETTREALCLKYTEDFEGIVIGFTDGTVRIFNTNTAKLIRSLHDEETEKNSCPVTCIQHRPVSKNYPVVNCVTCTYTDGCVKSWNHNSGQCIYTIRENRQTYGVTYHPRLPKFVTYGDDLKVNLYDEETRTQERILASSEMPGELNGHASRIFAACFNPRSNHELITGGWDDIVYFWDLRQPYAIRHLSRIHMCGQGLDISRKGTEVLTCSWQKENSLQLWDYGSGELIVTMEPDVYNSLLYCGKFISKDFVAVGGSDDHLLRVVDLQTYSTLCSITGLPGGVYDIDTGPHRPQKFQKDVARSRQQELSLAPRLAFISGKKVYQIEFV